MTEQTNQPTQANNQQPAVDFSVPPAAADGQWLTLQAASDATGFAEATLRRYIKRRKIKFRRLGRSINSKIEVWITPDMIGSPTDSPELFDEVTVADLDVLDQTNEMDDQDDYTVDPGTRETLQWLRERLDDKDAKIEALTKELLGASYRNGYLESEVLTQKEQLKLLTDSQSLANQPKSSPWKRLTTWLLGKKASD